jgi:alpha-ketoglutarate-dependent 2,4-dichlorophenoxyacetate dioxygenase
MRAAYDGHDASTKALVEDLVCEHSLMYSRGFLGTVDFTDEEGAMFRPVRQRLVRTHLVMWDNRQMMHRARRYDETQPRDMRRTTLAGDTQTTAQVAA